MVRVRRRVARAGPAYRGVDRRRVEPRGRTPDRTWIAAGIALAVLLVAAKGIVGLGDPEHLRIGVRASGMVLGVVVAVASLLFWRTTGRAVGVSISTAGWLITFGFVVEIVRPPGMVVLAAASMLLAAVWVARAIIGPDVDTTLTPGRQALVAVGGVALLWGGGAAAMALLAPPTRVAVLTMHAIVAVAWTAVAVLGFVAAVRGTCVLRAWASWMALASALSVTAYGLAYAVAPSLLVVGTSLRLCALLIGAVGATVALARTAAVGRDQLYDQAASHLVEDTQRHESERELAHEIRNALLAIEGATQTLDRNRQRLNAEQRAQLEAAIGSGVRHLRRLVIDDCTAERAVQEVVRESVGLARLRGVDVDLCLDPQVERGDLQVEDRLLRQVLDNILINAEVHGTSDGHARAYVEVSVDGVAASNGRAGANGQVEACVRVRDDGPGIPDGEHERIFARGYRLEDALDGGRSGDGIGLHVSRRLVRARGGDLVILPSTSGACFEVRLPVHAAGTRRDAAASAHGAPLRGPPASVALGHRRATEVRARPLDPSLRSQG